VAYTFYFFFFSLWGIVVFNNFNLYGVSVIQKFFEFLYAFVLEMLTQQAGRNAVVFFPFMYSIFFFILLSNLFGMLPFGFTVTAHLSVTFFLAFSFNFGLIILGFYKHGLLFLNLFVPSGTPLFLLPLIVVIEVVSYLIRTFSLSIRLFANMMAGHCLLFVISSFVFSILNSYSIFALPLILVVYGAIFLLEFAIAFLQAYVFTILLCIYLNDSLHVNH
jgi:F-type H+-transporting ATPase subunit a